MLTEQQFKLHDIDFDVIQVIGPTNNDPVSIKYRWIKQKCAFIVILNF